MLVPELEAGGEAAEVVQAVAHGGQHGAAEVTAHLRGGAQVFRRQEAQRVHLVRVRVRLRLTLTLTLILTVTLTLILALTLTLTLTLSLTLTLTLTLTLNLNRNPNPNQVVEE